ncbi:MAG: glycogen synthase GlgA [Nitrospirota bacterium]|nr:glycogen synthase GlgA [Nitrospirota bacterium]MDE3241488.1 glycogen synthase GlgA [Nitrospirota bacterium]
MIHKPLKILFVSPEAAPFAKTGGLADVAGALPCALAKLGHQVRLVIPRYGSIDGAAYGFKEWLRLEVPSPSGAIPAVIERGVFSEEKVPVLALRHDPFFARAALYGEAGRDYPDNLERFTFLCRAVMELLPRLAQDGWMPDVLHAHDWQSALCMVYPRTLYAPVPEANRLGTVFTIHNIGYQGHFPEADYPKTGLGMDLFTPAGLEFYKKLNLMKGGLLFADRLTTVSPTYSREIQTPEFGFGLEGVVRERADRLVGIVNGIDTDAWDPETDHYLPSRYSLAKIAGKSVCKMALQQEMHLPVRNVPLLVVISRLSDQKGLDLVADIVPALMTEELQLVLLGSGDPDLEARFRSLHEQWPQKFGLRIGFDDGLAHRIQAGGDLFLMPSRYEPCGLSQLYSLRYGTIPIVRQTGGLADTVAAYGSSEMATGFAFKEASAAALLSTIRAALAVYAHPKRWAALMQAGMKTDVSWAKSARAYADLYEQVRALRG